MLALITQWDIGSHITLDFDSHDADLEWRIINASVKSWMFGTISLEFQGMLNNPDATAFSLWTTVDSFFVNNKRARQVYLTSKIYDIRQGELSASSYVAKLKQAADAFRDVGKPIHNDELIILLLKGLSDRHKMTGKLIRCAVPTPSFDDDVSMLLMDKLEDGDAPTSNDTAFATFKPAPAPTGVAGSPSSNQGKTKRKCYTNNGGYGNGSSGSSGSSSSQVVP
jgi:hypothetical protein